MKFPDAILQQIKDSIRLSDYIGRTVPLKRAGKEMVGLSPFNKERTPSFYVNDEKAFYFDFSSGRTGDIFEWVKEREGLDFVQCVKHLAGVAGVPLPEDTGPAAEAERRRDRLSSILEAANAYYQRQLLSAAGREARAYLEGRGLGAGDWSRFEIGFALNGNAALKDHLTIEKGIPQADVISVGLLATPDDGRPPYDRFRNRIMFPIRDHGGRLVSFGGRALDPKSRSKYLNGSETEIFDKGRTLYGLAMARKMLAGASAPLLVVEGYMDVIACLRAGVAACAPMGTALTPGHLDLMWKHHPQPTLCFDGDAAGLRAKGRACDVALPRISPKRSLSFVTLDGAKDADELLREKGANELRGQVGKAAPMVDILFQREAAAGPLDTPEQRADLRERLTKVAGLIEERDLRREYANAFTERLRAISQRPQGRPVQVNSADAARALRSAFTPVVSALAYWMVRDPSRVQDHLERLAAAGLGHPEVDKMIQEVVTWAMCSDALDGERLTQHLYSKGFGSVVGRLADPGGRLESQATWTAVYKARADYIDLERAVQQAKASISTPADMQNFLNLKAQRDQAKRAL